MKISSPQVITSRNVQSNEGLRHLRRGDFLYVFLSDGEYALAGFMNYSEDRERVLLAVQRVARRSKVCRANFYNLFDIKVVPSEGDRNAGVFLGRHSSDIIGRDVDEIFQGVLVT